MVFVFCFFVFNYMKGVCLLVCNDLSEKNSSTFISLIVDALYEKSKCMYISAIFTPLNE